MQPPQKKRKKGREKNKNTRIWHNRAKRKPVIFLDHVEVQKEIIGRNILGKGLSSQKERNWLNKPRKF